jgi:hypothetical protein
MRGLCKRFSEGLTELLDDLTELLAKTIFLLVHSTEIPGETLFLLAEPAEIIKRRKFLYGLLANMVAGMILPLAGFASGIKRRLFL